MKILIITGIFEPDIGGPATYTPKLAAGLVTAGHTVTVITYADKKRYDRDKSYPFTLRRIVRSHPFINMIKMFFIVVREVANHDIVYFLDYVAVGLPAALATRMKRKPYLVRVGGDYLWEKYMRQAIKPVTLRSFYNNKMYNPRSLTYRLIKFVLSHARIIIFNNDGLGDLYSTAFKLNKDRQAIVFNPTPRVSKRMTGPHVNKEIIYAGRFIPLKNLDSLIKVFAGLKTQDFNLTLIGEGPQQENLEKLIVELDLDGRVKIETPLSKEQLLERLQSCYLFILPSYSDINPNLITECLGLGVPFVVTEETFLPYRSQLPLVLNPTSLQQMAGALESLLAPDNYQKYSASLRQIDWSYSWDDCVASHVSIFKSIL